MPAFKGTKIIRDSSRNPKVHGHIPGICVGSTWKDREGCSQDGVHAPLRAGIHGNKVDGAYSVVLSGGYEDDEDRGETITYTGQGGRDTKGSKMDQVQGKTRWEGPQCADQEWIRGNRALQQSSITKNAVRVVRGHKLNSPYAPAEGYRYDGLYQVEDAWRARGKNDFMMFIFRFQRIPDQPPLPGTVVDTMRVNRLDQGASRSSQVDIIRVNKQNGPLNEAITHRSSKSPARSNTSKANDTSRIKKLDTNTSKGNSREINCSSRGESSSSADFPQVVKIETKPQPNIPNTISRVGVMGKRKRWSTASDVDDNDTPPHVKVRGYSSSPDEEDEPNKIGMSPQMGIGGETAEALASSSYL